MGLSNLLRKGEDKIILALSVEEPLEKMFYQKFKCRDATWQTR